MANQRILFNLVIISFVMLITFNTVHATPANLELTDFYNGIHDQYSLNFINTSMTARGNTGVSLKDLINVANYNPAAFRSNHSHFSFEILVKDGTDEFNSLSYNRYESPMPISFFGVGLAPYKDYNFGFSYALNRSLKYNSFTRDLYGLDIVDRYPQFCEHQITFTSNINIDNFSLGINNILLVHKYDEYRNEGKVDDISFSELIYRPQFGLLYELEKTQFGLSFTPKTSKNTGDKYIKNKTTYPTNFKTGISYNLNHSSKILFDTDISLYSETSSHLNDQITLKFGYEKSLAFYTLKAGFIHSPSTFEGEYLIKNYSTPDLNEFHPSFYEAIPQKGNYRKTDMNILTFGTSINIYSFANLHFAYLTDLSGNVSRNQFMSSLDINLSVFKKK